MNTEDQNAVRLEHFHNRLNTVEEMIRDIHEAIVGNINGGELGLSAKVNLLWTDRERRAAHWWSLAIAVFGLIAERLWHIFSYRQ